MATAFTGVSRKNLTDTLRSMGGRLLFSYNPQTAKEPGDSDYKITLTGNVINAEIGSNVKYAAIHNFGGQAGRNLSVTIPKRPYFDDAVKDLEAVIGVELGEYFTDKFGIAVRAFTDQGEDGLLKQFKRELSKAEKDLEDKLPVLFQGFIGSNMSEVEVSEDWRNG